MCSSARSVAFLKLCEAGRSARSKRGGGGQGRGRSGGSFRELAQPPERRGSASDPTTPRCPLCHIPAQNATKGSARASEGPPLAHCVLNVVVQSHHCREGRPLRLCRRQHGVVRNDRRGRTTTAAGPLPLAAHGAHSIGRQVGKGANWARPLRRSRAGTKRLEIRKGEGATRDQLGRIGSARQPRSRRGGGLQLGHARLRIDCFCRGKGDWSNSARHYPHSPLAWRGGMEGALHCWPALKPPTHAGS